MSPPPLFGGKGEGAPQNLMGGLSQNIGGAWGSLKCCQKIPVKEFDSKVAGYKPGFQLNLLILIEFPNILHWKSAKKIKLGVVLGQNLG